MSPVFLWERGTEKKETQTPKDFKQFSGSRVSRGASEEILSAWRVAQVPLGDVTELILIDRGQLFTGATHPFHLHGYSARVVAYDKVFPACSRSCNYSLSTPQRFCHAVCSCQESTSLSHRLHFHMLVFHLVQLTLSFTCVS